MSAVKAAQQGQWAFNSLTGEVYTRDQLVERAQTFANSSEKLDKAIAKVSRRALLCYRWRNRLLLIGFALLVTSRVLAAYWTGT